MNRRSKAVMLVFLGVASGFALADAGCELLVTFPASEIDSGAVDGFLGDGLTEGAAVDAMPDVDAELDVVAEKHKDAPHDTKAESIADSTRDVPAEDTSEDVASDTPMDTSSDAPEDIRGQ